MSLNSKAVRKEVIQHYLIALVVFLSMSPYFIWKTFTGVEGNIVTIVQLGFVIVALLGCLLSKKFKISIDKAKQILGIIVIAVFVCLINGSGIDFYPARIIVFFSIAVFIAFNGEEQAQIYDCFLTIVAISLLPGIIVFLLNLLGINIPYENLQPTHEGKIAIYQYYKHYFGAVEIDAVYSKMMPRLCGMFDEPGVVGTFCALFVVFSHFDFKDWRTIIFVIAGIFSLSLAFVFLVLLALGLMTLSGEKKQFRIVLILILLFIVVLMLFPSVSSFLFSRIGGSSVSTVLDGRIKNQSLYDAEMENFLQSDFLHILFGMGYNASSQNPNMAGSYYYTMTVYDHGFFTIFLIIVWFIGVSLSIVRNAFNQEIKIDVIIAVIVFFSSITQRPYILTLPYMVLFLGGGYYIAMGGKENVRQIGKNSL